MSQYDNPFTGTPLGWDNGESGWGEPLNTTLLQTAFYHNRNIDGVLATVSLLPVSPANGVAYLVEENLRVYFRSNSAWSYSVPPDNMVFTVKTTGVKYKKDGAAFVIDTTGEFSGDATEITTGILSTSRTPAFTGDVTKPEGSGVQTLAASGVSAGSYGTSTEIPVITLDVKGRATSASTVAIPDATASVKGLMTTAAMTKLNGIATGAEVNVNADWNSVSGDSQILNKPTLGTAAAATLTTSTTDDTVGRVLRVGDFGWGKIAISINQASLDSTSSRATGLYTVTTYTSGIVNIATPSPVWHLDVSANYASQWLHALPTFAGGDDGHVYYRDRTGAVWAPWKEVWTSNTQLSLGTTPVSAKTVLSLNNVDNTSDSVKNSAVATLTNKTISGASNTLNNIAQSSVTNLVSDLGLKAPLASPTFTGTVVLPTTTSIGSVVSAEIGYLTGVSSAIQTQLNNKQPLSTPLTNTTAAFTTALETKLNGIATGAEVNVNADWNSASGDSQILNKPTLGTAAAAALTTSSTDTTAGRVLKVGDFGLGSSSVSVADFTATEVNVGRIFRSLSGATGGTGVSGGTVSLPYDGTPSTAFLHVGIDYRVYAGVKTGATATPIWLATLNNNDKTTSPTDTTSGRLWRTNDLVKTTSNTDTTGGSILQVGDGGLLKQGIGVANWNNLLGNQFIYGSNTATNRPSGFAWHVGLHLGNNNGHEAADIAVSTSGTPSIAFRTRYSVTPDTYSSWLNLWHTGNTSANVQTMLSSADNTAIRTNIGLGTAATATLATSITDNTIGRVLRVGDFGVGTDNLPPVANGAALDALSATGTYSVAAYTSGIISVAYSCPVIHISRGSNSATQIYFETDVNRIYTRSKAGAVWSAWVESYNTGNLLNIGTSSASAKTAIGISNVENTALSTWTGSSNLTTAGALVAASLAVTGNLTVNGTTTTVNSTVTTVDDPIITLGGDSAPVVDDNKDRGIEYRWHNGTTAKVGFFGLDDSTGKFTFIPDATNTSEVISGAKGTIDANLEWADVLSKPDPVVTVTLTGDVTGSGNATLTDLGNGTISFATTIAANSVALGTDTTGNYVATGAVSGNGLSGSSASEGGTFTVTSNATDTNTASTIVYRDVSGNFSAGTITAALSGNASTATTLATGRTIAATGDVTWTSPTFNGSGNVTAAATVVSASTSVAGKVQLTDSIASTSITTAATPNSVKTAYDLANGKLSSNQTITLSGDATGSGSTAITVVLANSGVTAATYGSSTQVPVFAVDAKGRTTSVTNTTIRSATTSVDGIVQLNDTVSSTSTVQAATANAVKTVNDSLTSLINTPKQTFQNIGSGSGARSITAVSGMHVIATASGNTTWTFPSPSATEAHALTLELTNGGAFTMTWPASTRWAGGVAPTLTASGTDILVFTKTGTSNWRGYLSSKDSK